MIVFQLVKGDDINRIFNYKYPYEYISGFDEMLRRKDQIFTILPATVEM